jgi:signal peptidase I
LPKDRTSSPTEERDGAGRKRAAFIFAGAAGVALVVAALAAGVSVYEVEGTSMAGTYNPGDVLLVESMSLWLGHAPGRFDVVLVEDPEDHAAQMLKRVVGLPGEKIELDRGRLVVNGAGVEMPAGVHGAASIGPVDTGDGYFVIGDNLEHSRDSRRFGTVAMENVTGRVWAVLRRATGGLEREKADEAGCEPVEEQK